MAKKFYLRPLREDLRLRFVLTTRKGQVVDFVVQLELSVGGVWKPCVRYNYAHGRAHRDLFFADGRRRKEWLPEDDLGRLIDAAQKDISQHFDRYLRRLGYA